MGGLRAEPSPEFFPRIRSSIERRVLGAQVLEMSLESLAEVALQYLAALMETAGEGRKKGDRHE